VEGYGIEIDEKEVIEGIERGLSILQGDLNTETRDFADRSFDYVILSQTLQGTWRKSLKTRVFHIIRVIARRFLLLPHQRDVRN